MIKKRRKIAHLAFYFLTLLLSTVAIGITVGIIVFVILHGLRPFFPGNPYGTVGIWQFLAGDSWNPRLARYGILHMIVATLLATFWSVVLAIPIALGTALYIAHYASKTSGKILTFFVETLAGIPSVFFGIFGFVTIRPIIQRFSPYPYGDSLIAVIILLTMMALPTMTLIMKSAIENVDHLLQEGSFALGASKRQAILKPILPAAKNGIFVGIMLGAARAVGETMAVAMVSGNRETGLIRSPFETVRLLTSNIILEQAYASELHGQLLWSTAVILLLFILLINLVLRKIKGSDTQ